MKAVDKNDIAIVGMAAVMPKAENIKEYWNNLLNGVDCIGNMPEKRRKDIADYVSFLGKEQKFLQAGYVKNIDLFDNRFFNITPKEAMLMSPIQRMFLETAYRAFYDAGYDKEKLNNSKTGVYVGYIGDNEGTVYRDMLRTLTDDFSSVAMSGNLSSITAGRVSYTFNLTGPSMLIDTACSSSLVAVYNACRDIKDGICDMALAGGIKLCMLPLEDSEKIGIESSNGRTKTFDESADGTGIGEGSGAVVLKSLSKAERDGDYIYAVIKGGYINQDGASSGMTAPNPVAQRDLYLQAWKNAGINPEDISYIESHGTGTKLGDPIEITGLTQAFKKYTDKTQFCAIGSVKTNIGHLYEAAGIASVIKTVLALNFGKIPKSLNFNMPNPQIDFIHSPFYVAGETTDWQKNGEKRIAGVSAFGFSGTNCHIILEEYTGKAKPYMESIEERLEKSTEKIFENNRFWFKTTYIPSMGKAEKTEIINKFDVVLTGKEEFSDIERQIGSLWYKHMGYEKLSVFDNFFTLGGDSIMAAKIVSDIQKDISGSIKTADVFSFPTIDLMAKRIESISSGTKEKIELLPKADYYRASAEQQRLYIVYQLENGDGTYNMPFVAEFNKKIDRFKLASAAKKIVQRHETLRTEFFEKDGNIWQRIKDCNNWEPEFEEVAENELKDKIKECQRPFDLTKAPLIRIKIFETEKRTAFFVDMHHIISDGTSMGIFIKEMIAFYDNKELEPLEVQYKDFSAWQEKYLESETVKKQEEYWQNVFADGIPVLRLPQDRPHPKKRTTKGGSYFFKESMDIRKKAELSAHKHTCTEFVILLSAYYIELHKLSRQESIVVGSPVSGRTHYQALPMIGMFVNMVPFKAEIKDDITVSDFIDYMKNTVTEVYDNQECQFEKIAEMNVKERIEGRNPVMDTLFAYQNMELPKLVLDNDTAVSYSVNEDSKYDIMLEIYNSDDGYDMRFEYYREIFDESTIIGFAEEYSTITEKMLDDESLTIGDLCGVENKKTEGISIDFDF